MDKKHKRKPRQKINFDGANTSGERDANAVVPVVGRVTAHIHAVGIKFAAIHELTIGITPQIFCILPSMALPIRPNTIERFELFLV